MSDQTPVTPEEALLQAYLERSLTHTERRQLVNATMQNPALLGDAGLFGLLRELRLEHRIAKHEDASWMAFRQQATQYRASAHVTDTHGRWQRIRARLWGQLQPAIPALAAVVIVVQTGGLIWLSSTRSIGDFDATRGSSVQNCPAVLARFRASVSMADVSQLLTQTQATIVAGPDASGFYRLQGPAVFTQDAAALMQDLVSEVRPAPDCKATS